MHKYLIDINADVGEGVNNESLLMPYISSCNIACGGHTGDLNSMKQTIEQAKQHQVKIGAHPSFPDKLNFGRVLMKISENNLFESLKYQIDDLVEVLTKQNKILHHIKPHGALYNLAALDEKTATVIVKVMKTLPEPTKLYVPYKSIIANIAIKHNIPIVYEAFADRNYNNDLTLVSRKKNHALIEDIDVMFNHVYSMISSKKVKTIQGLDVDMRADTFCIHGDNPKAVSLIKKLVQKLKSNHIEIA